MRLTPAQIGMLQLLNTPLPFCERQEFTAKDRVKVGREFLVDITKCDFGYDPQKWHEHLRATDDGGYRWSNKHLGMPKRISQALADPDWQAAVNELLGDLDASGRS